MPQSFELIYRYKNVAYLKCEKTMFPLPPQTEKGTQPYDLLYQLNEIQMADQMGLALTTPLPPLAFERAPRLLPLTTGFNLQVALTQDGHSAQLEFVRSYHTGGETELVSVATCHVGRDRPHTLRLLRDVFHAIGLHDSHQRHQHRQERLKSTSPQTKLKQ